MSSSEYSYPENSYEPQESRYSSSEPLIEPSYEEESSMPLEESSYVQTSAPAEEEIDRIWFCDAYSKTFAMEDRARLMEKLLENAAPASDQDHTDKPDRIFSSPHVQTKLRFYFYTLRQAFENSRWPEETVWEAELHRAIQ